MHANIRWSTAVVMIGICAFSIAQGLGIVHFSLAMANIDSPKMRAEIVNTWRATPDVAATALQADLTYQIDPSDQKAADHRRQTLTALVSIKPMFSYGWLSLSGLQLITDQPMEEVFASLELSMLSGPNEGHVMGERAVYAASLWERLPEELKSHVVADVAAMMSPHTPAEGAGLGKFQAVLAAEPDWARNELKDALVAIGISPKDIEKRLGF